MRISRAGSDGRLIRLAESIEAGELHAAARSVSNVPGVKAVVPGHHSLLVLGTADQSSLIEAIDRTDVSLRFEGIPHTVRVSFAPDDAPDLSMFLEHAGISRDSFLVRLAGIELRARYLGFLAGFAYLDGWPAEWSMPRRPTSRDSVPAGSFAIAGKTAGFYPITSPGGWNLLGRTSAALWRPEADRPNLFAAGDIVRIEPSLTPTIDVTPRLEHRSEALGDGTPVASVRSKGQDCRIVPSRDLARYAHGLPPGGPFDHEAAVAANAAVGNGDLAVLECALVGPDLAFEEARAVSWYGADAPRLSVDGRPVSSPRQFVVPAGSTLSIGPLEHGLRGWLAIQGGWCTSGTRHRVAPPPIATGDLLHAGGVTPSTARFTSLRRDAARTLRVMRGPHDETEGPGLDLLRRSSWIVSPALDRTGIRLDPVEGAAAEPPASLPSCGVRFGTVQWHPDGSLVVMGPDHPVTGGYLQPATVVSTDLWKLAQLRPGDVIAFEEVDQ